MGAKGSESKAVSRPAGSRNKPASSSGKGADKYKSGQNSIKSGLCIATNCDGSACPNKQAERYLPYCSDCMRGGDPSMSVEAHPKFGKMLVASRDLPKGYRACLWGEIMTNEKMPEKDQEWGFETQHGDYINPVGYNGSQVQFCQCPGPNERVTVTFQAQPHCWVEDCWCDPPKKRKETPTAKYGSFIFVTTCEVPKNHQLMMMYAEGEKETEWFFKERGIVRADIGTEKYPALRKKAKGPKKKTSVRKSGLKEKTKKKSSSKKTKK